MSSNLIKEDLNKDYLPVNIYGHHMQRCQCAFLVELTTLIFKICSVNQATSACTYYNICQWCGSIMHVSTACDDADELLLKVGCRRRCFKYGRLGHID